MGARSTGSHPTTTKADGHLLEYFRNTFVEGGGGTQPFPPSPLIATGGVISDYTDPGSGNIYRAHVFTTSGTFEVTATATGPNPNNVDYLVVGGGAGGGVVYGGGGGAGGLKYATSHPVSVSPYSVVVGAGGRGGIDTPGSPNPGNPGNDGTDSSVFSVTAGGGGKGAAWGAPTGSVGGNGRSGGGSGGGGGCDNDDNDGQSGGTSPGDTSHPGGTDVVSPSNGWGNDGSKGRQYNDGGSGGGGGAAATGETTFPGTPTRGRNGGNGAQYTIANGTATYYAGGGGGGVGGVTGSAASGGNGGGGNGGYSEANPNGPPYPSALDGIAGTQSTGGGGGGSGGSAAGDNDGTCGRGGNGGSGIVVVRYRIGTISTAKATGGAISFYGGKTIHTFTGSGTFATTSDWDNPSIEYVVVGGGGGGGGDCPPGAGGGGGGAGGYLTGSVTLGAHPNSTTITIGQGGLGGSGLAGPTHLSEPGGDTTAAFPPGSKVAAGGGRGGGGPANGGPPFIYYQAERGGSGGGGNGYTASSAHTGADGNYYPPASPLHPSPAPGQGNDGGSSPGGAPYSGAGGGGSGAAGESNSPATNGGSGGQGTQFPTTFRNPASTVGYPGPGSTKYFVAGGGGGGSTGTSGTGGAWDGSAFLPGGPYSGAGNGNNATTHHAGTNSGSGGGGGRDPVNRYGGNGGSGIVLIAYPT